MRVKIKKPEWKVKVKLKRFQTLQTILKLILDCVPFILTIVWAIVIFQFSAQTGTESALLSRAVYKKMPTEILWVFQIIPIRKMAHIIIYTVLSFLTLISFSISFKRPYIWTTIVCYGYACLDELHQLFTLNRGSKFMDTLIDLVGVLLGLLIGFIIISLVKALYSFIYESYRDYRSS